MPMKPLHEHTCDNCRFLGRSLHSSGDLFDHYACDLNADKLPGNIAPQYSTLIARRSSRAGDYYCAPISVVRDRTTLGDPLIVTYAIYERNLPHPVQAYPTADGDVYLVEPFDQEYNPSDEEVAAVNKAIDHLFDIMKSARKRNSH